MTALIRLLSIILLCGTVCAGEKLRVLIIDGQNNHKWQETTPALKWILESCGRFTVDVTSTPAEPSAPMEDLALTHTPSEIRAREIIEKRWNTLNDLERQSSAHAWEKWRPSFENYDLVLSNYNGSTWPAPVRKSFVDYIAKGGGFVSVHAADNAFGDWREYNEIIGLGGWGGRDETAGARVRIRDGSAIRDERAVIAGRAGSHSKAEPFMLQMLQREHPILKGLPPRWMHATDELYGNLRGPAKKITVLASASSHGADYNGDHEPILMTIDYGKGRIFHTTLGHSAQAMSGLGFQITLQRGAEWAATGAVTINDKDIEALSAEHVATRTVGSK